jgi:hypothetical protein
MGTYIKTSIWKVNPVLGIGATHAIIQNSEWSLYKKNHLAVVLSVGASIKLNDQWDIIINYTPTMIYVRDKSVDLQEPDETTYRSGSLFWPYWGGITFAHRF